MSKILFAFCMLAAINAEAKEWEANIPACEWTKLEIGMTRAELLSLCGLPWISYPTVSSSGFQEQAIYEMPNGDRTYIYISKRRILTVNGAGIKLRSAGM